MSHWPSNDKVLAGENAILKHWEIMGATNPKDAAPGTIVQILLHLIEECSCDGWF